MKNPKIVGVFAEAVKAKIARSDELGILTTWTTKDHLSAVAKAIAVITDPEHDEAYVEQIREVVEEAYNISAFQQTLEKAYAAQGRFQREGKKAKTPSELYKQLGLA